MKVIERWDSIGQSGLHELLIEMSVAEAAQLGITRTIEVDSLGKCNVHEAKLLRSADGESVRVRMDVYEQVG